MVDQLDSRFRYAPGQDEDVLKRKLGEHNFRKILSGTGSSYLSKPINNEAFEQGIIDETLSQISKYGLDYGDLRFGLDANRFICTNDENISQDVFDSSIGIGVRVVYKGFWGFSATNDLTHEGIVSCVDRAVQMAKSVAKITPVELALNMKNWAAEPKHVDEVHTPVAICPFEENSKVIAEPMIEAARVGLKIKNIKRAAGVFMLWGRRRYFASTEGSRILTTHLVHNAEQKFFAVTNNTSAYRTLLSPGYAGGLEHFYSENFPAKAEEISLEAVEKCFAKKPESGNYDLILDGHNLALTMHESVGHPTELDRVLGYELSMAGGSFASVDKLKNFKYGSSIVNFTGDNTILFGGASQGYDDEGVLCQRFPIIRDGMLVSFGSNRETAHAIDLPRAQGTTRSQNWYDVPIVRIPNLYLEPGRKKLSLSDLIKDTQRGILMKGRDSFSIDQMRYNFQFGADMCYLIKDGKIIEPLRDVIYQSITPEFWNSCDAICDESQWQMHGIFNCGKGHPMQAARMMHGASPARFRNIKVGF